MPSNHESFARLQCAAASSALVDEFSVADGMTPTSDGRAFTVLRGICCEVVEYAAGSSICHEPENTPCTRSFSIVGASILYCGRMPL